jgi:predicted nucleic acid-binding protein
VIFVDTSVWYALLVPDDPDHAVVSGWFNANSEILVTSDHVVAELLTLMRARGHGPRAVATGGALFDGSLAQLHHVSAADLLAGWDVFRRYVDKDWSFTDCVSYALIGTLHISITASLDHHFRQFGTVTVVP